MYEVFIKGPDFEERRRFEGKIIIGRGDGCALKIPSPSVSSRHLSVDELKEGWLIVDLNSTNGTYVQGKRIRELVIGEGEEVGIGDFVLYLKRTKEKGDEEVLKENLVKNLGKDFSRHITDVLEIADRICEEMGLDVSEERRKEIAKDVGGYGIITDFLFSHEITEVMVNGTQSIYIEKGGKLIRTEKRFDSEESLFKLIDRILLPIGKRVDESSPYVDARLPDGSRVHIIISPVSVLGPVITIRKFSSAPLSGEDLISRGAISLSALKFLEFCVKGKLNIVVCGGTSSGKTTLLNLLASFIPLNERIITVEDVAELKLNQPHVIPLEARPPNVEGKGEVTIRELVRNCLRMRPDRIIVGECRGAEALDMLQAMNTGHDGSMTTLHANSPRDALSRIEAMVMMSGMDLPLKAVRFWISSAIDLVIHVARLSDGSRRVMAINEVVGMEEDVIVMHECFEYRLSEKKHAFTGYVPECLRKVRERGLEIPKEVFE